MKVKLRIALILTIAVLISGCTISKKNLLNPELKKGEIDLHLWNFSQQGEVNLNGEWEFYFHKLDSEIDTLLLPTDKTFINVPSTWDNKNLSGQGYGTYRCRIILPFNCTSLCIRIPSISTAYNFYCNKKLVGRVGNVGRTAQISKPQFLPSIYQLPKADTLDLTIEVSNFNYKKGGIWEELTIDDCTTLHNQLIKKYFIDAFLTGSLIIMALYHLGLYILRRRDKSPVYFAGLCFFTVLRLLSQGEDILVQFIPSLSWEIFIKIEFISFFLLPALGSLFVSRLFPKEFSNKILYTILVVSSLWTLYALIFDALYSSYAILPYQIITVIILVYLFFVIISAVFKKRENATYVLFGFVIIFVCTLNDMLLTHNFINSIYIVPYGIFIYFFVQSYVLTRRFSDAFSQVEQLSAKLVTVNIDLEHKVNERTSELVQQKLELEVVHTDITASIKYAQRIQTAVLPSPDEISGIFKDSFILFKPKDIVSGDFYWFKSIYNYILFAAADCTGHGVPAALLSMMGIVFFNEITSKRDLFSHGKTLLANEILNKMREKVKSTLRQTGKEEENKDGFDIAFGIVNIETLELQFSGANSPLYIVRVDKNKDSDLPLVERLDFIELIPDKMPIGIFIQDSRPFTNQVVQLQTGDAIYLFSDGYCDQFGGPKGRKFYSSRFKRILTENFEKSMTEQQEILETNHTEWRGSNEQIDDILVMGIRVNFDSKNLYYYNWKGLTILVVDDDEVAFNLIVGYLNFTGANFVYRENGKLAVEYVEDKQHADIILMDLDMPVMDGFEATKLIKTIGERIPVIILTAVTVPYDKFRSFEAGCDDYIIKPVKQRELLVTIDKYL